MPSPLDKTLLHQSFMPAPACTFALCLVTHILFCCGFDIFGNSGKVLNMASASALVRAFLVLAEAPDMVLVFTPVYWFRCYLSGGQQRYERCQGNSAFYTPVMTSSSLVLESMTSSICNLIGCHGAVIGYQGNSSAT